MLKLVISSVLLCALGVVGLGCDGDSDSTGADQTTQFADLGYGQGDDVLTGVDTQDSGGTREPVCESDCEFIMKKQCVSETAYAECGPVGACLQWGDPVECDDGWACEEGQCVQTFGDLDCIGVSKCVGACGEVQVCQEDCFTQGSEQGQADFEAFLVCTDTNCGLYFEQEKLASGSQCTLENCETEYLKCVEVGSASCSETLQCMQGCGENGDCLGACATQAEFDALVKLTDILVCFENNCPDPAEWEQCATSACLMQSLACL